MQAVIIAGGEGTRLRPYTHILPKPLLPIGLKSIIEINIIQLKEHGIDNIIIAVGYLGHLIESIIGNGDRFGLDITYSYEKKPLGTVGALGLIIDDLQEFFIIMNGDILHNYNFKKSCYEFIDSEADALITVYRKKHRINLGVLEISDNRIKKYIEKPTSNYFVSAGIYQLKKNLVVEYVVKNQLLDFPTFINYLIKDNKIIIPFYHEGLWIDLGTENEYQKLIDNIDELKESYPELPIKI